MGCCGGAVRKPLFRGGCLAWSLGHSREVWKKSFVAPSLSASGNGVGVAAGQGQCGSHGLRTSVEAPIWSHRSCGL